MPQPITIEPWFTTKDVSLNRVIEDCEHVIELDSQNHHAHDLRDKAQRELERLNESL